MRRLSLALMLVLSGCDFASDAPTPATETRDVIREYEAAIRSLDVDRYASVLMCPPGEVHFFPDAADGFPWEASFEWDLETEVAAVSALFRSVEERPGGRLVVAIDPVPASPAGEERTRAEIALYSSARVVWRVETGLVFRIEPVDGALKIRQVLEEFEGVSASSWAQVKLASLRANPEF